MRRLAGIPLAAWVAVELYLTIVPLLGSVPRWLFEASRLTLLAAGLFAIVLSTLGAIRYRRDLRGAAFIWFMLAIATASVCLIRWLSMTFPLFA